MKRSFMNWQGWFFLPVFIALFLSTWIFDNASALPKLNPTPKFFQQDIGDVDGNGVVDEEDARLLARFVVGQVDQLPQPQNADVNQDEEVTIEDALAIAQSVTGETQVVVAGPVHGLPGKATVGNIVRIEVFEHFIPYGVTGGTARIQSASKGYDSGEQPLTFERNGRSLYYHWDTRGLKPASDYEIFVTLEGTNLASNKIAGYQNGIDKFNQANLSLTLDAPVFEIPHLARVRDAFAPAPGIPLEFRRVFPQDHENAPYLGPLGRGWVHNYDVHLEEFTDGRIAFLTASGFNRWFESNDDGTYTASPGDYGSLFREPGGGFFLQEKDGFHYHFHPDLLLDFMEDTNGNRITAIYNANRQLVEVQHSNGSSFKFEYNSQGRISEILDHVGRATIYSYDEDSTHLLNVTATGDRVTHYTYSVGQGQATDHRLTSIEFPDGTHRFYTYDSEGRLATYEGDGSAGTIVYSYEQDGTTLIMDENGSTITMQVNEQRLPLTIINAIGDVTTYQYDSNFNLGSVTFPDGRSGSFGYDSRGNITQLIDPFGNQIDLGYEANFNRINFFKDSKGNITSFTYDERANLIAIVYPDGSSENFAYTPLGLLEKKTNRESQTIGYNHDERGLLVSKTFPGGSTSVYTYDEIGRLNSAANQNEDIQFTYDNLDRITSVTYSGGRSFNYQYNILGRRSKVTDPDGRVLNYEYNNAGRLVAITEGSGQSVVQYSYDNANRLISKTLGNGSHTSYVRDPTGLIVQIQNYDANDNIISFFNYTYDSNGDPIARETIEGAYTYGYDAVNQLTSAVLPNNNNIQIGYDGMGNRTQVTNNDSTFNYVVNNLNQYEMAGSTSFEYDTNGNLISKTENSNKTGFEYDFEGRLTRVYTQSDTVSYTYNALGLRSTRSDSAGMIRFLWDGTQVAIEENENKETIASYIWGETLDEIIRMSRGNSIYYYALDAMLSVSVLTDESGTLVERYRYGTFGEPLVVSSVGNPWYFTGRPFDFHVSLQYNRARYYSPTLVRFLTVDPVNVAGGLNLYSYALNNPNHYLDPSGLAIPYIVYHIFVGATKGGAQGAIGGAAGGAATGGVKGGPKGAKEGAKRGAIWGAIVGVIVGAITGPAPNPATNWAGRIAGSVAGDLVDPSETDNEADIPPDGWSGDSATGGNEGGDGNGSAEGFTNDSDFRNGEPGDHSPGGGICPTFVQLLSQSATKFGTRTELSVRNRNLVGQILVPVHNALLRSDVPIFGVAGGNHFKAYRVEYGNGENPTKWRLIKSSTIPQNKTDLGMAQILYMQGDIDIRGNLSTWNVGLRNWVHLPWHPPEDSADLNGVYTIRLVVEAKDGQTVEDRVTAEVGRVIAQCLPGIAISPDKKVVMRFPEQSLTSAFRVYTILPLEDVGEKTPSPPENSEFISDVYRIREPGDRFIKDVGLEFSVNETELTNRKAERIAIAQYDTRKKEWVWLPTQHILSKGKATFSTTLIELPKPKAVYALVYDSANEHRSQLRTGENPKLETLQPISPDVLVNETFEEGFGHWKERDRFVGAVLARNNEATPDSSYCLKVSNDFKGGNFSVTVLDQPFDVKKYPIMSIDYRVKPGVKTDFYLLVNGRWYNLGFTDDPIDFRHKDVNIGNLGRLENIHADDRWHSVSVNLYKLLAQKTRHTQIDAIVMADWDVGGYMKLEFGNNARDATYYIDNFRLSAGPEYINPDLIAVDDFNPKQSTNLMGGASGVFSNAGANYIQATRGKDNTLSPDNSALKLTFDASKENAYCGYWTSLQGIDLANMSELHLRIRSPEAVPSMLIGLRHAKQTAEATVPIQAYVEERETPNWQSVRIPLGAFIGNGLPDLTAIDVLFFKFENRISSGKGTVLIDDIEIHEEPSYSTIANFAIPDNPQNYLGGKFRIIENKAAAISTSHFTENSASFASDRNALSISYGGTIGLSYGGRNFSYAIWETDLLGFDARKYESLVLRMRGQKGNEKPNLYLDDGTTRRPVRAKEFAPLTTNWQEIRIPLEKFASQGVDLSHLEILQLVFEWQEMSGTIYVSEMRFEDVDSIASDHKVTMRRHHD